MVLLSIGNIGGVDRTFACKSQKCLWQDWYILSFTMSFIHFRKAFFNKTKQNKNNNKQFTFSFIIQVRSQLSKNDRAKFNTVLIIDVHARDIIDGFVRDR